MQQQYTGGPWEVQQQYTGGPWKVQQQAAAALGTFIKADAKLAAVVADTDGVLPGLVLLLGPDSNDTVHTTAAASLHTILKTTRLQELGSTGGSTSQQGSFGARLVEHPSALSYLAELLATGHPQHVQAAAARVVEQVTVTSTELSAAVGDAPGVIAGLVSLLADPAAAGRAQELAAAALAHIASERNLLLASPGAFQALERLLLHSGSTTMAQAYCAMAVGRLAAQGAVTPGMAAANGLLEALLGLLDRRSKGPEPGADSPSAEAGQQVDLMEDPYNGQWQGLLQMNVRCALAWLSCSGSTIRQLLAEAPGSVATLLGLMADEATTADVKCHAARLLSSCCANSESSEQVLVAAVPGAVDGAVVGLGLAAAREPGYASSLWEVLCSLLCSWTRSAEARQLLVPHAVAVVSGLLLVLMATGRTQQAELDAAAALRRLAADSQDCCRLIAGSEMAAVVQRLGPQHALPLRMAAAAILRDISAVPELTGRAAIIWVSTSPEL